MILSKNTFSLRKLFCSVLMSNTVEPCNSEPWKNITNCWFLSLQKSKIGKQQKIYAIY